MLVNIDLTPHRIRVVPNSDSIRNRTPINLVGTALSLQIDEEVYTDLLHNRAEESIIHTIFERKRHGYVEMVIKVRWDNNTVGYSHYGQILLLSTVVPMSESIWGPPKKLLKAKKSHDISKINRQLNKNKRSFDLGGLIFNDSNSNWTSTVSSESKSVSHTEKAYNDVLSNIQVTEPAERDGRASAHNYFSSMYGEKDIGISTRYEDEADMIRDRKYGKVSDLSMSAQTKIVKNMEEDHSSMNAPNPFEIQFDVQYAEPEPKRKRLKPKKTKIEVNGKKMNYYTSAISIDMGAAEDTVKELKSGMNTRSWTSNVSDTTSYTDNW